MRALPNPLAPPRVEQQRPTDWKTLIRRPRLGPAGRLGLAMLTPPNIKKLRGGT